jgi:hypothetical protein
MERKLSRGVVWNLSARMAEGAQSSVGNSLDSNLTKYMGEEGLAGTLPSCVAGGICLGNPLFLDSSNVSNVIGPVMALGVKKTIIENWPSLHRMAVQSPQFRSSITKALTSWSLAGVDDALSPIFARNDPSLIWLGWINTESPTDGSATTDPFYFGTTLPIAEMTFLFTVPSNRISY